MLGSSGRRVTLGVAVVAAALSIVGVAGLGTAHAAVGAPRIVDRSGFGSVGNGYGAGCTYVIAVPISAKSAKTTVVAGRPGTRAAILYDQTPPAEAAKVTVWWTPPAAGRYRIIAGQVAQGGAKISRSILVDVKFGLNTGSSCLAV